MQDNPELGRIENAINTYSRPAELKITDLRMAVVRSNFDYPILRIDTNQGVYGIGEVRDAGHRENALQYKSILLGQNPCNVDLLFRALKRFGGSGRLPIGGFVQVRITGSDAHDLEGFDDVRFGVTMARKAWLGRRDVLNTRTVEEIDAYFTERRGRGR